MDDAFALLIEEVSLDGAQGCTLERLFALAQTCLKRALDTAFQIAAPEAGSSSIATVNMDDDMKAVVWKRILAIDCVEVMIVQKSDQISKLSKISVSKSTLQQLSARYGDTLVVRTDEAERRRMLCGDMKSPSKITDHVYQVLEFIAKFRKEGTTAVEASRALHIEPRNIFSVLKRLVGLGLITKKFIRLEKTYSSHLVLSRFSKDGEGGDDDEDEEGTRDDDDLDGDDKQSKIADGSGEENGLGLGNKVTSTQFRKRLMDILASIPSRCVVAHDLRRIMKVPHHQTRIWARQISALHDEGYLNIFKQSIDGENFRCLEFLKPYTLSTRASDSTALPNVRAGSIVKNLKKNRYRMNGEYPLDQQLFNFVDSAGPSGVTSKDITISFPLEYRRVMKMTENLVSTSHPDQALEKFASQVGRLRFFRFVSARSRKKQHVPNPSTSTLLWGPQVGEHAAAHSGQNLPLTPISSATLAVEPKESISSLSTTPPTLTGSNSVLPQAKASKTKKVIPTNHALSTSPSSSSALQSRIAIPDSQDQDEGMRKIDEICSAKKGGHQVTINERQRLRNMLELIRSEQVVDLSEKFITLYQQRFPDDHDKAYQVSFKTMRRAAEKLEMAQLIRTYSLEIMSVTGNKVPYTLMMDYSLDSKSEKVRDYITRLRKNLSFFGTRTMRKDAPRQEQGASPVVVFRLNEQDRMTSELLNVSNVGGSSLSTSAAEMSELEMAGTMFSPDAYTSSLLAVPSSSSYRSSSLLPSSVNVDASSSSYLLPPDSDHIAAESKKPSASGSSNLLSLLPPTAQHGVPENRQAISSLSSSFNAKASLVHSAEASSSLRWRTVANRYGYISAKMHRVRVFHNFLWAAACLRNTCSSSTLYSLKKNNEQRGESGQDSNAMELDASSSSLSSSASSSSSSSKSNITNIHQAQDATMNSPADLPDESSMLPLMDILRDMSLDLYIRIVPRTLERPVLDEYLTSSEQARFTPMNALPPHVLEAVQIPDQPTELRRCLRAVKVLFDILWLLGLVRSPEYPNVEQARGVPLNDCFPFSFQFVFRAPVLRWSEDTSATPVSLSQSSSSSYGAAKDEDQSKSKSDQQTQSSDALPQYVMLKSSHDFTHFWNVLEKQATQLAATRPSKHQESEADLETEASIEVGQQKKSQDEIDDDDTNSADHTKSITSGAQRSSTASSMHSSSSIGTNLYVKSMAPFRRKALNDICIANVWRMPHVYSATEKRILENYAQDKWPRAIARNYAMCHQIAIESNIPVDKVISYYLRKSSASASSSAAGSGASTDASTAAAVSSKAGHNNRRRQHGSNYPSEESDTSTKKPMTEKNRKRGRSDSETDRDELDEIDQDENNMGPALKRSRRQSASEIPVTRGESSYATGSHDLEPNSRKRDTNIKQGWNPAEDHMLTLCGILIDVAAARMGIRAGRHPAWASVAEILDNRTTTELRKRLIVLGRDSDWCEKRAAMHSAWIEEVLGAKQQHQQQASSNDKATAIGDEIEKKATITQASIALESPETILADIQRLKGILQDKMIQNSASSSADNDLAEGVFELEPLDDVRTFWARYHAEYRRAPESLVFNRGVRMTTARKIELLQAFPLGAGINRRDYYDSSLPRQIFESVEEEYAATLVKMVLASGATKVTTRSAHYRLLSALPEDLLSKVHQKLLSRGIIVRHTSALDGHFELNSKHEVIINNHHIKLLADEAHALNNEVSLKGSVDFDTTKATFGGDVLAAYESVLERKNELIPELNNKTKTLPARSRGLGLFKVHEDSYVDDSAIFLSEKRTIGKDSNMEIIPMNDPVMQSSSSTTSNHDGIQLADDAVMNAVLNLVSQASSQGATLSSLKDQMRINFSASAVAAAVSLLVERKQIISVGFRDERFVLPIYADDWNVLQNTKVGIFDVEDSNGGAIADPVSKSSGTSSTTRIWSSVESNGINSCFETAARGILHLVITNPGICEFQIIDLMQPLYNPCETREILGLLIKAKILSKQVLFAPKKVDLFSSFEEALFSRDDHADAREQVSCFFAKWNWSQVAGQNFLQFLEDSSL